MKKLSVCLTFMMIFCTEIYAWDDGVTHPLITEKAVENSGLDSYLQDVLNFDSGIKTEIE
ncbi:hypothetical protein DENIS_3238 [Desulfonema ishimotonii]|uniref:Uncharacterized protein n=1 Tax=Desulfonema ishimotonii TaxID=45657 RepID=A0A401FZ67_9BACT|nr:hypothetical protein [Desulfonema ishimotonii]GBC62269.1 hypothetical protein DENIS_3238 [Desulfonema ishimotonii]